MPKRAGGWAYLRHPDRRLIPKHPYRPEFSYDDREGQSHVRTEMPSSNKPIPSLVPRSTAHQHTRVLVLAVHRRKGLGACQSCELHQLERESFIYRCMTIACW